MIRTTRKPAAWRARSRARSASKAARVWCVARPSSSTTSTLRAPEAVDLVPDPADLEVCVGLGEWQAGVGEELSKPLLELASGQGDALPEQRPEGRHSGAPGVALQQRFEGERVPEALDFGFVDGSGELSGVQDGRQIEQCSRHRGDGDALVHGDLVAGQFAVVALDPGSPAAPVRAGHLDQAALRTADAPEHRTRAETQARAFAAGQHGGHPPAMDRQPRMADRVHAAVNEQQPPQLHAVVDRLAPKPEAHQLDPRDHPVLRAPRWPRSPRQPNACCIRPLFGGKVRTRRPWGPAWRTSCYAWGASCAVSASTSRLPAAGVAPSAASRGRRARRPRRARVGRPAPGRPRAWWPAGRR